MSQENISEYLNPSRFPRMAFGLKANSTLHRITLTPSNANPGETLYIEIPKLTDNMVIVPGSVFLVFNLAISGHENNTVVNNISRNLVKRQRVVFGGETLQDTTNYDLFQTYHDLFLPKDDTKSPTYAITNLELEYRCISSKFLAEKAHAAYKTNHAFFYENILHHKTFTFSKPNDSVINEQINVPRRSMTGILLLFTENPTAGDRDSEKFVNPDIKSVQINIDGVPNMLYSKGMLPTDQWESIKQRFPRSLESEVTETKFYTEDKFALWIDLRSHADNEIHGSGLALKDTRDGVKLEIRRKVGGSGNITCDMFIVADALMQIKNSNLNAILY